MIKLSIKQQLLIYFKTPPFILTEFTLIFLIVSLFSGLSIFEYFIILILIGIAGYFNYRKIKTLKDAKRILSEGHFTEASLTLIEKTGMEHNERIVFYYSFLYSAKGKLHFFDFSSAYHRDLKKRHEVYHLLR